MRHLQLLGLADGEAEEHGIARHVGGEDPAQSEVAQSVYAARGEGEGQEYPVPPRHPQLRIRRRPSPRHPCTRPSDSRTKMAAPAFLVGVGAPSILASG